MRSQKIPNHSRFVAKAASTTANRCNPFEGAESRHPPTSTRQPCGGVGWVGGVRLAGDKTHPKKPLRTPRRRCRWWGIKVPACANSWKTATRLRRRLYRLRHPSGPPRTLGPWGAPRCHPPASPSRPLQDVVRNEPRPFSRIAPRVTCANRVWLPSLYNAHPCYPHPLAPRCVPRLSSLDRPLVDPNNFFFVCVRANQSATVSDERNRD